MSKTCALSGHRDLPPEFDKNVLYDTLENVILEGYDEFLCGMARGFDLVALECLIALRQKYRIRLVACIPFEGQSAGEKAKYEELLSWCDEKHVIFPAYRGGCYLARDRYMVDRADALLAYCKKESGGTVYTIAYAKKNNKPVRLI